MARAAALGLRRFRGEAERAVRQAARDGVARAEEEAHAALMVANEAMARADSAVEATWRAAEA
jgi:hypothetical protein